MGMNSLFEPGNPSIRTGNKSLHSAGNQIPALKSFLEIVITDRPEGRDLIPAPNLLIRTGNKSRCSNLPLEKAYTG